MGLRGCGIGWACGIDLKITVPEVAVDRLFQILVMSTEEDIFARRHRRICCIREWQWRSRSGVLHHRLAADGLQQLSDGT